MAVTTASCRRGARFQPRSVARKPRERPDGSSLNVALFIACFNDALFPSTGRAVVTLLERLGHRIEFPLGQTCCGQMHFNSGYRDEALPLARHFVDVFGGYDVVVSPSASCVGMVREQYPRLAEDADAAFADQVGAVVPSVFELSEFLVDRLGVDDVGAYYPHRVTYHPTCHGLRALRLGDRPLRLLRRVRGIDLIELPDAEECCGFGGTFAVKNADVSAAMLGDKVSCIARTRAEVCTAGDNSCLMHIGGGLARLNAAARTVHLAEILAATEAPPAP